MIRHRVAVAVLATIAGCGDDGGPADAGFDAAPDAMSLCPGGELDFEALVTDRATASPAFEVALTEVADPGNTASSAPNGRALLCLSRTGTHEVRGTRADLLSHLMTVDDAAAALHRPQPFAFPMLAAADADALIGALSGVGARDAAATQLFVDVREYPGGVPLVGASVSIGASNDGGFHVIGDGSFTTGTTLTDGSTVLFANVAGTTTTVSVDVPGSQMCEGAASITLESTGAITSVFFACR